MTRRPPDAGPLWPGRARILTSGSPVATQIPHATGAALASKIRGDGGVSIVYFGDGASSKGDFHEGLNFAAIHKLPAIFVCENNHYAISVPTSKQMAVHSVADRAVGYGMFGESVDGTDALAVYRVGQAGRGPRAGGRRADADRVQRGAPDAALLGRRRPALPARGASAKRRASTIRSTSSATTCCAHGLLDADGREPPCAQRIQQQVDDALAEAEAAADPAAETAFDHVYAGVRMPNFRDAADAMTVLSLVESVRKALEEEMAADPTRHRPRRGRRRARRRLPRHRRPAASSSATTASSTRRWPSWASPAWPSARR